MYFYQQFYMPVIQKLKFHLPHVHIIGTYHFGKTNQEAFKHCSEYQDFLFHRYYVERVVSIFVHQIQSEYYSGHICVSIKVISLENFSAIYQGTP